MALGLPNISTLLSGKAQKSLRPWLPPLLWGPQSSPLACSRCFGAVCSLEVCVVCTAHMLQVYAHAVCVCCVCVRCVHAVCAVCALCVHGLCVHAVCICCVCAYYACVYVVHVCTLCVLCVAPVGSAYPHGGPALAWKPTHTGVLLAILSAGPALGL